MQSQSVLLQQRLLARSLLAYAPGQGLRRGPFSAFRSVLIALQKLLERVAGNEANR